uniref:Protein kinase domain-containing protein n=1 Tax=Vitis vinifera TaxID=29760 RepID=F6H0T6_VITVI
MNCTASNHLLFTTSPNLTLRGDRSPKQLLFFFCKIPTPSPNGNIPQTYHTRQNSVCGRVHSPHFCSSQDPIEKKTHAITEIFVLFVFSLTLLCIRLLSNALLPDFPQRWRSLVAFSEEAEARVSAYPSHLWKAIVAYEDRRFFSHFGVDPVGIARAALSLSALGGGSTITQQSIKFVGWDCSCLGIFHENSSGSCYLVENVLGSLISSSTNENVQLGCIKVLVGSSPNMDGNNSSSNQSQEFPIAALVLLPSTGFFLFVALGFLWWRRWGFSKNRDLKLGHSSSPSSEDLDAFSIPGLPIRFEYEEIEAATDNFKTQIGSGGFGAVYKGIMPDKTLVAVKKITNLGVQGKKEFCTEIAVIGNIHHVNLVKLKGFCAKGRQRLLVYEYMNRSSLDRTLFSNGPVLEWQERVDIALGTARGLAYLHSGCEHKIIHCDVKPENILLHDNFQAKISDFGLSKLLSPEESTLFTTMRGTRGYLAPEWLTSSAISDKTDVYSFGMVLLELVSGRKNCSLRTQSHSIDDGSSGGGHSSLLSGSEPVYFPLFALEMHEQGRYLELADPRLEGRVTSEEVEKLVLVALCCVHEEPTLRPCMVSVVGMLEGGITLSQPRTESLNFLRFYGRRFTEASMVEETDGQQTVVLYPQANLVKNTCLKNERTFSRKIVEMVLALALERTISKWRILSLYMSKIYWGHGIYGVESASIFYFGKHPSLLCLGESALLAGIIPAPELRSPFRDCSRGKTFQARVLKRMVEFGFLDVETALLAVKQSLQPRINCPEYSDGILLQLSLPNKGLYWASKGKQGHVQLPIMEIWDWEKESKVWEVMEEMENWACRLSELKNNNFRLKLNGR